MTQRNPGSKERDIVKEYIKAISNETRLSIWLLIVVYRDITLDDISHFLGKSKSTVHHHIQILLDSDLIEEVTKPGSKTRYYRRIELDLSKRVREYFAKSKFDEETPERQKELANMYEDLVKILNIEVINTLQYLLDNYYEDLDEVAVKRYVQLDEISIGSFNLSEESAAKFRKEQRELALRYMQEDREHPERKKPFTNFYIGYHVENTLKRKFKKKIKF